MKIIKLIYKIIGGKETCEGVVSYYDEKVYFKVINKRVVLYTADGYIIQRPEIVKEFKYNKAS